MIKCVGKGRTWSFADNKQRIRCSCISIQYCLLLDFLIYKCCFLTIFFFNNLDAQSCYTEGFLYSFLIPWALLERAVWGSIWRFRGIPVFFTSAHMAIPLVVMPAGKNLQTSWCLAKCFLSSLSDWWKNYFEGSITLAPGLLFYGTFFG